MREFWIIFKQAFMTKAKTKSFIITTMVLVLGVVVLTNLPKIITIFTGDDGTDGNTLTVLVEDDALYDNIALHIEQSQPQEIQLVRATTSEAELVKQVEKGDLDDFTKITMAEGNIQALYQTTSLMSDMPSELSEALQAIQSENQAKALNLSAEQVATLFVPVDVQKKNISPNAKSAEEYAQAVMLIYAILFLIYFAVILYASMIATEVATEKSSRVMELLISSISPAKHMFAKIFGIGSLGLVQMLLIGITSFISISQNQGTDEISQYLSFSEIDPMTIVYGGIFFILGYFIYATLAALLGSLVSRTEDVQQMIMPMTFLILIAFFLAMFNLDTPEVGYLKWASFFPFFTPIVMFMRVGLLDIPTWEPVLGIIIMIVTIIILGWFASKVYKGGVLMYGPSRSLKDIKKALQLGKE